MQEELDKNLCRDFPEIFKNRYGDIKDTCMYWGFECGDGWEPIIRKLCKNLMLTAQIEGIEPPVASQVKEKYGQLNFYVESAHEIQYNIIDAAENYSGNICEICGESGWTRSTGYWLKTLCKSHAAELKYSMYDWEAEKLGLTDYLDHMEIKGRD